MQETGNSINTYQKLTIRICAEGMSFSVFNPSAEMPLIYKPYVNNCSISVAANLREAIKGEELLKCRCAKTQVLTDTSALMIPVERFDEKLAETLYHHAFPQGQNDCILYDVLPDLNAVAVFAVNKDLKLVLDDHFTGIRFTTTAAPVWHHLHERSFTGNRQKLFAYFHNKKVEVFCFNQNRFKFCNTFGTGQAKDAIFYILYVWKQLALNAEKDELHIVGDIPERDWLTKELRQYLRNAFTINPKADYNRSPVTAIADMPYDLQTLLVCGR